MSSKSCFEATQELQDPGLMSTLSQNRPSKSTRSQDHASSAQATQQSSIHNNRSHSDRSIPEAFTSNTLNASSSALGVRGGSKPPLQGSLSIVSFDCLKNRLSSDSRVISCGRPQPRRSRTAPAHTSKKSYPKEFQVRGQRCLQSTTLHEAVAGERERLVWEIGESEILEGRPVPIILLVRDIP